MIIFDCGARRPLLHSDPQSLEFFHADAFGFGNSRLAREETGEFVIELNQLSSNFNTLCAIYEFVLNFREKRKS
jgi:hypothetical protein